MARKDEDFSPNIVSDECLFQLNGFGNKQNTNLSRYWLTVPQFDPT